jgi:hypothetical protein
LAPEDEVVMSNRTRLYAFLAGLETFHALVHAYLSVTRTHMGHPVELLGIKATPRFHAGAAAINAAIALGLGAGAVQSARALKAAA